jgi:hypothetical protein
MSVDRSKIARLAAYEMHAKHDARVTTAKARAAADARFETMVDPEGKLSPQERGRRADAARKAHYIRMGLRSAEARRNKTKKAG